MQNLLWEDLNCVKHPSSNESCGFVYNLMNCPFVIEFVSFVSFVSLNITFLQVLFVFLRLYAKFALGRSELCKTSLFK